MIWGQNFTNDKTGTTPCLETSVGRVGFISGLATRVALLCSSGSWDVVGEGAVNRIIYLG